jgi:hypothetical protein
VSILLQSFIKDSVLYKGRFLVLSYLTTIPYTATGPLLFKSV